MTALIIVIVCACAQVTCAATIHTTTATNHSGSEAHVELTGSNLTHSVGTRINGSTDLPALVCVAMNEGCPRCPPHESSYRCFLRGFLGVAIPLVLILGSLIVIFGFCYWNQTSVRNIIYKYRATIGGFSSVKNLKEEEGE